VPGEIVVLTTLKILDGGAHISYVVLLLSPHRFLVHKDPLFGRSDMQRELLSWVIILHKDRQLKRSNQRQKAGQEVR